MLMKFKYLFMVAGLIFCLCQNASAELVAVGPVDLTNHFPSWYMDENGLSLQLCLTSTNCTFDPLISSNAFSQLIGFGEKAFYWSADAELPATSGAKGSLKMALVASFSGSTTGAIPADGEQITFFQIAVGPITGLTPGGVYTVTHPYGVLPNLVADSSGIIPIQMQDIGCASQPCDFTAVLGSAIGPFLKWDTGAPAGFIGNPAIAHTVVGSPFGTNVFRVEGPNANPGALNPNIKETKLFKVQGKLFTGAVPTPLVVHRATYTRPLPSAVNVSATSAPTATLLVSGTTTPMRGDGNGNFFAHIPFSGAPPDFVTVTATNPPNIATTGTSSIVDVVTITLAEYNSDLKTLTIEASSSDQATPPPVLTAVDFDKDLTAGKLTVTDVAVPPTEVTVTSSAGGSDTAQVTVTANVKPIARNDTALVLKNTSSKSTFVDIKVLANDTAVTGTFEHADAIAVPTPGDPGGAAHGSTSISVDSKTNIPYVTYTPNLDFVGKDSFKYTANALVDSTLLTSNTATVNITVFDSETLTVTKAVFIRSSKWWQISGKSTVKSGNKITLYVGTGTSGTVIGTVAVNLFGGWSFSQPFSPPSKDPGTATSITAVSTLGSEVTFPLTIK